MASRVWGIPGASFRAGISTVIEGRSRRGSIGRGDCHAANINKIRRRANRSSTAARNHASASRIRVAMSIHQIYQPRAETGFVNGRAERRRRRLSISRQPIRLADKEDDLMRKVTPFLWFDHEAEEAAHFYVSVFKNSRLASVNRAGGRVMTVNFELDGQPFIALNAGPHHKFNEAVSFFINCETQEEVDMFWERLSEGGEKSQCGWVKDRWGLSWQVVPNALTRLMGDPDPIKSKAVLDAMLKMKKIVIADLQAAHDHASSAPAR